MTDVAVSKVSSRRVPELDGLRGSAVLLVLVWHFVGCSLRPETHDVSFFIWKALSLTWCGVDLFFVLSGYLIGGILIDSVESPRYFKTFYIRRAARIFPAYYLFVAASYLAQLAGVGTIEGASPLMDGCAPLLVYVFYIQNIFFAHSGTWGFAPLSMTWSLAVEEQFYLLFPAIVFFLPKRFHLHLLIGGVVSGWIIRVIALHLHSHPILATYCLLPCRWDSLCFGALLAWTVRMRPSMLDPLRNPRVQNWVLLLTVGGTIALTVIGAGIGSIAAAYAGHSFFAVCSVALIGICVTSPESPSALFLRAPALRILGTISYSLYLLHGAVQHIVYWCFTGSSAPSLIGLKNGGIAVLALSLSIAISIASWRFMERPILEHFRRTTSY